MSEPGKAVLCKIGDRDTDNLMHNMNERFRAIGLIDPTDTITVGYLMSDRGDKHWFVAQIGNAKPIPNSINSFAEHIIWLGENLEPYQLIKLVNDRITEMTSFFWKLDRAYDVNTKKIVSLYHLCTKL